MILDTDVRLCYIRRYDLETRERLLFSESNLINKSVNNDRTV